jgi:hypothetical protein
MDHVGAGGGVKTSPGTMQGMLSSSSATCTNMIHVFNVFLGDGAVLSTRDNPKPLQSTRGPRKASAMSSRVTAYVRNVRYDEQKNGRKKRHGTVPNGKF